MPAGTPQTSFNINLSKNDEIIIYFILYMFSVRKKYCNAVSTIFGQYYFKNNFSCVLNKVIAFS
jgi:hypothetical protein